MKDYIYVVCEGQSEASFVKHILSPYFQRITDYQSFLMPSIVITSNDRKAGRVYTGGLTNYSKAKNSIIKVINKGRAVTTMFDYFRLPNDFPGYDEIASYGSDCDKVLHLEEKIKEDICSSTGIDGYYFRPYIQLHEFEALFFADLDALKDQYIDSVEDIELLKTEIKGLEPEDINDGYETAPSKRLGKYFNYRKGNSVMYPLGKIGVDKLRRRCPHFSAWIEELTVYLKG